MARKNTVAVAYYRTSSATNVGADKDSQKRQSDAVESFARQLPEGARVLDAGAGEGQYAHHFSRQRYCAIDLAVGDVAWDYSRLSAVAE